jgi:hypothetical protein
VIQPAFLPWFLPKGGAVTEPSAPAHLTVKRYHYDNHSQLANHLNNFIKACNFAKRLKTLRDLRCLVSGCG